MFNFLLHHLPSFTCSPKQVSSSSLFYFQFLIVSVKSAVDDKWDLLQEVSLYLLFHCPGCNFLDYFCFLVLLVLLSKLWVIWFCSFLKSTLTIYVTFVQFSGHAVPSYEFSNRMNLTSPRWKWKDSIPQPLCR